MPYDNPAAQQNQTPSHVHSVEADAFVLGSDLLKEYPNLLPTYYKQVNQQLTTMQKLNVLGMGRLSTEPSSSPFVGHYEKQIIKETITVGSIASGTNPNEAVITLDASSMISTTNEWGQTFIQSRPRVSEVWQFVPEGKLYRIIEKDESVNPHTITVQTNGPEDPQDEIIPGEEGFYVSTVHGEYTGQPRPLRPFRYRYTNTFWIGKETEMISGSHLTTKVGFNVVPGSNLLFMEGMRDMEQRFEYAKGKIWMFGQDADPANQRWTDFSDPMQETVVIPGTEGLLQGVGRSGYVLNYDPADFGIEDVRALTDYYESINLPTTRVMLIQGSNVRRLLEDDVADRINYTWCVGVSDEFIMNRTRKHQWGAAIEKDYNPEGMFLNLGITGFVESGYTFMMTGSPEFNNQYGAGAVGYRDHFIAAPFGIAADADNTPYIGYSYRGTDGYSRENEVWYKAGAGNSGIVGAKSQFVKTSQYDGVSYYLRTEIAPHFALLNMFAVGRPNGGSPS